MTLKNSVGCEGKDKYFNTKIDIFNCIIILKSI